MFDYFLLFEEFDDKSYDGELFYPSLFTLFTEKERSSLIEFSSSIKILILFKIGANLEIKIFKTKSNY